MRVKRYKHIVWDWNGTLLDDAWLCVEVINDLLGRHRLRDPITLEDYRNNFGFPVVNFYTYLGFPTDEQTFKEVSHHFIGAYEERWLECSLHRGSREILAELSAAGLTHSVLSAAHQDALDFGVEHFGLKDHFMRLVGLDNILAHGKIEQGRRWATELPWEPSEILLIGDTLHDFEVAEAMGADCLLLTHGHHPHGRLERCGVPLAHSFEEMKTYLLVDKAV